ITHACLTPALLREGTDLPEMTIRPTLILGGEAPSATLLQALSRRATVFNAYGPTEITVCATTWRCPSDYTEGVIAIGRPTVNTQVYLLNTDGQPVPLGAVGELYIGGIGVARGYLNRPDLTAERFLADPFSDEPDARLYRTGDLARYLPDGNLEFLGRNDQQVKIRGFRIEPGEIEARLIEHLAVSDALVLTLGDGQDKRLVAYVVAEADDQLVNNLYAHLRAILPDYMVPAAFIRLDTFPLTPNGKLDRRALPAPGVEAFARQVYAAPQGEIETRLAAVWRELLGIEQVSRHDSFFALGGHSLLAVRMVERLRNAGLTLAVRDLFQSPVLSEFAQTVGQSPVVAVPTNVITSATTKLTPEMLPLIDLTQTEIDHIIEQVPGGIANIQDIYALSPLQDGILFHHLLASEGDPYLLVGQMVFADRALLDSYLVAVQQVINRHDILRTAFIWQGLSTPVQVVWCQALLSITELTLNPIDGPVRDQLAQRFDPRRYRIDLKRAPLLHFVVAQEEDGRWSVLQLLHHLIGDHTTLEVMNGEVQAYLAGQEENLSAPVPFRNLVAQARLGGSQAEHTRFFTDMLAEVDEPTLPFGLTEVHRNGSQMAELHRMLTPELNNRLRSQARRLGVSLAALCHLAWAQVLSRTSGQAKVVFGTVLFGRMQVGEGVDSGMGLFINTLPLRLDIDETSVQDSVRLAHTRLAGLLEHEHASLALAQRCSGVQNEAPLFSALLNYRHNVPAIATDAIISGIEFLSGQERTNYPLVLSVEDFGDALGLTVQIVQPIDPERICGYMQQALESLAAALEQQPEAPVRLLNILPASEKKLLLESWNATQAPYPDQCCIHRLFEQQAENTPDAIALIYGEHIFNYAELNARANRLARRLIRQGIQPDERIAVLLERSIELVVAQLAILKAGAVYVPIDPSVPDERKHWLIRDCSAKLLLTDIPIDLAIPRFCLADEMGAIRGEDYLNLDLSRSSTELAYIMYTSGSTGMPKGVMVPHRAVVRLVINNGYAEIGPDDRVAFEANPVFDASTFEVWAPLLNGGALVVIDHATVLTPKEFAQVLRNYRITVLWLSVGLFNRLAAELSPVFPQLNILIVGGDVLDPHVMAQVLRDSPPQQLLNGYGPSEGTTFTTTYRIATLPSGVIRIPIGRPIANTRVYLLDANGQPVPLGVEGEIYIGGDGVACGYLNRPELTAERFLPDPFSDKPDARLYRTGDLARYLPDGNLEFLGRNDQQVKIRGFRIEPGEIEARLMEHPAVHEAVVLVMSDGQDKRLVAYVVAEADEMLVNHLRDHLSAVLPDYMVPAAFVCLDAFPLTPNGKLDRRALPAPGEEDFARQIYAAPSGEMETTLAAIWRELLSVERISRYDNFFALGGHSLLAVRMMNRIAALGIELPLSTLFTFPTLMAFAEVMSARFDESGEALPAIIPLSREGQLPLSFAQQRLWFLAQFEGVSETYHIPLALRLRGRLDIAAWQRALDTLFARHEALRSVFVAVDGQPQVELLPTEWGLPMRKYDLRDTPDVDAQLASFSVQEASVSFDLARGPLIRSTLVQLADNDHVFLLTQHHIVSDGWSLGVLKSELETLYSAYLNQQPDPLLPLTIQYPDYAAWQCQWLSAAQIQSQSDYWCTKLADVPVLLDLPTDRPRPPQQSFAGNTLLISLDAELTQSLKLLSEQQGVTLFMTLLAAWATVLSRLSGQEDLVIGTPSAGRSRQEVESLIGFFVNTLALRMDLSGEPSVAELLARVRQTALAAQEHQDLPFEQVVEIVQPSRRLAHTPLFQVMFAWQNNENTEWRLPGLVVSPVEQAFDVVKFDLELNLFEVEGRITGYLNYATALFDQVTIERQVGYLHTMLREMVANPQQTVGKIDILTVAERKLLLETRNVIETRYPKQLCIHQLFEQQVENEPNETAVVYEEHTLSYGELNARANRLAHQLIALGVIPDQRVAVCVSRSPAMVVGVLAVLKAGGAYVPLDPVYTGERLTHILTDAAPAILLADNVGRDVLGEDALAGLTVLDPNSLPDQPDSNPQVPGLTAQHLAYVIYTSGSTGTPKGVMVEHRHILRLFDATESWYRFNRQDIWCLFHSIAFDFSVWELWGALRYGAKLVLVPHAIARSPQELHQFVCQHGVTVLNQTPSAFKAFIASYVANPLPDCLRYIIFGGEALEPSMLKPWYALREETSPQLVNMYGITETTVHVTYWALARHDVEQTTSPIGTRLPDLTLYLLDKYGQPVPSGAVGELYIGGAGVARGYLNRPELTAERFLTDPFSHIPDARMYRTGDLARYLPDGNLEFLGRNDQQVKIRGFRIEPGEIEARLMEYPAVREAVVLALDDGQDKRLVAYVVAEVDEELINRLRTHLGAILPDYMVPAAFVRLETFPLTPNGKLDRRALPAPGEDAFARQVYAAPQGETETLLATVWSELLGIEQISRHDSFFALGGHSLLAVRMIERLRNVGLTLAVRDLFQSPVLSAFAQTVGQSPAVVVPANVITPVTTILTPDMLPLIDLTQPEIDHIVEQVPGGMANIQDIYALSPLQDGILFHHLLANKGDPYLLVSQTAFVDRSLLDSYLAVVQQVINRHDILRTAFIWQGLSTPVQVVWRQAPLSVTELTLDPIDGPVYEQLIQRFDPRYHRLDLSQAPLLRFMVAQETDGRWIALQLQHHLIGDHTTLEVMNREVQAYLTGREENLSAPVPFRNLVAQVRLGVSQAEHTRFFTDMLAEVDEPTLPFGLTEVHRDGSQVTELHRMLPTILNNRLRSQARRLGVSLAALCHLAWAQVLSRISGQEKVVFGTVLFGRMQGGEGADSGMGLFVNTLPLRLDINNTPVQDSARLTHTRLAELLAHEHASLALAQRCSEVSGETPLFSTLLNYRHSAQPITVDETISGIESFNGQERTNYPFTLSVEDFGHALGLTAQVVQPFDPKRICGYMQQALESLVEALEQAPETPVRALNILPEVERRLLLKTWNATETVYPKQLCVHQLFEQQVEKNPDATALVYEEQTFSYAELNTRANRLAHQLIALGIAPDQRVAICVTRSPTMVVGLLAVLKAGGAYVPLDPAYPGERLAHILTDAAPAILLADNVGCAALGEEALSGLTVLDPNTLPDKPDSNPQVTALTAQHLAYVIYTSGSTGTPKGVMVEHRGLINLVWDKIAQFDVHSDSRILQFASLSFDASVWEIMVALGSGASLIIAVDIVRQDPLRLWHYLEQQAVTHACLTPAFLRERTDLPEMTIRPTVILGGEAPSVMLLQALSRRATVFNAYGPTEITVCATTWRCPPDYTDMLVPIGHPTANTQIYLLDSYGQPVPLGVVGELYVGGVGVARGYLNRPELTAERFLSDPFSDEPNARLYRTGDLARYLPDGNLEFLGRNDQQVKIRGFRIEPGEIEARLMEHPAVQEAVVLVLGDEQNKRLVAYIVAEADEALVNRLRTHLSAILPDYMVPAAFVRLNAFPLTPNGKLDRRALPVPGEEAFVRQIYAAPSGEMETTLAAIWRELLGVERISRYDNFFALGGHSLLAVRMMNRIAALEIELPLSTLFTFPALADFAEAINTRLNEQSSKLPVIIPLSGEGKLPLSFAQQRLWFLSQFDGVSETYHIPVALHLRGRLDIAAWQQALDALFSRHKALRSVFVAVDGQPQVELLPAASGLPMKKYDLRNAPDADAQLASLSAQETEVPFNLTRGPLIRSSLVQLANDEHVFLLTLHHIIFDGWSVSVLMRELNTLYTAFLAGQPDPLPPLTIQYPDYAAWQRQWLSAERIQSQSDYWRTKLADAPILLDLPTDRPRPPQQSFAGNILLVSLDAELTQSLKRLSEQQGVTLFMTLLAAWATVLSRLSGQDDVVIGTPSAGRSRQEVESLIGFFVNTLALRMDLSGAPNVTELLARVRQTALAAQEHQDLPFEQVVEIVQPSRQLVHTPLFQVMFAWQSNENRDWMLPGLTISPVGRSFDIAKFDLELNLSEMDGRIVGYLNYATTLFDQSTVERQVGYLHTVLREMTANPQQPVGKIDILTVEERKLLLESWNATQTRYPDQTCIHRLFEQQTEKTPDAVALVYEERILSYAELNARANRLAYRLIERGVQSDDRIAVLLERSIELVVAQLAILKAGAVYVPIDPRMPDERKNWLISDCSAKLLLSDILVNLAVLQFCLDDEMDAIRQEDHCNLDLPRSSTELAYIMYTSGSTGTPKGVMVPHRAVVRLAINNGYAEIGADDRVAFEANPVFDASTFEVWAPLLNGGALVVIDHATLLTPKEFVQALQTYRITVLWLSVGLFNRLATALSPVLPQIKTLIVGGDILDPHVIAQVLRDGPPQQLLNGYGPSEGTTFTTTYRITALSPEVSRIPIGRPIANTRVYLLDTYGQPVPQGVTGEIYIGGDGVACGYLNRPELTAERFLLDPFSDKPDARLYRTGDLARYLPDGNLEFLGRNDQQVKIRGFRIEPGEIEVRLMEHPAVSEAVVLAQGDSQDKRLVAYVAAEANEELVNHLRTHLSAILPDYMVPAAFVRLDTFPLTPNGKLDRRALPAPGEEAFARQVYAAPQGVTETTLAAIWSELLGVEQVSRHDSFFALGGHSLLAVRMIERLRNAGLILAVRDLFQSPVLSAFAQTVGLSRAVVVPANVITPATTVLTPEMLPLIELAQPEIDHIVEQVPGGMANIQDIYALSPLQDGILFHHLLANKGDPYLLAYPIAFADRSLLDRYLAAVQQVINRHDILRTAFVWQGLSVPAQVVWRQASLSVTELTLDPADGPVYEQLSQRFDPRQHRLDLGQAPLLRFVIAQETDGRWIVLQLQHHLIGDHTAMDVMNREVQAYLAGQGDSLPVPIPFRNLVAQARLGMSQAEHTRFFTDMLAEVDQPTLPFGLTEVHRDGSQVAQSHRMLPAMLNDRLRHQARRLGVSLAALCHLAWAQVLSRTSGQEKVVFGTVLFGRMQAGEGGDSGMGLFINTLPLRLDMDDTPVQESVQAAHTRLAGLLEHEHASLALAQRCSGVQNGIPLFSALLNYRHNAPVIVTDEVTNGIEFQGEQERTNYPFVLSVEDFSNALGLTTQIVQPIDPERICDYMQQALESLADALEQKSETPIRLLNILPEAEKKLLLESWNATQALYPDQCCMHRLFEQQAEKTPDAIALMYGEYILNYAELNARANRLARRLIGLGIRSDDRVAVLLERSVELVIAQLAILKAGAVYVPLDLRIPDERLHWLISDCSAKLLLTDIPVDLDIPLYCFADEVDDIEEEGYLNLDLPRSSTDLAYIMYTSGSTGTPKGVMVPHRAVVRLVINNGYAEIGPDDRVAFEANPAFDASTFEVWAPLLNGGTLVVIDHTTVLTPQEFVQTLQAYRVTVMWLSVGLFNRLAAELSTVLPQLKILIVGGDVLDPHAIAQVLRDGPPQQLLNGYGPSEGTTFTTTYRITALSPGMTQIPIGRPIANTRVYLLDIYGQPVPQGVTGEIYIGGDGVACGYLNRPELTAERFLVDPFSDLPDARMYRTGDLARYLPDGNLEFLGRNDQQIKIRGFRIEPGEIEARLVEYPTVQEAIVLVLGDGQDKRLVAYVVAQEDEGLANSLHTYLSAILPDYMVPSVFVRVDDFPLTPNGKLDRHALPAPGNEAFARQVYEAPQGEMETVLVAIWCELLAIEQVSRYDNFFALGGHSLLAMRMINLAANHGLICTLNDLFQFPVLSELAAKMTSDKLSQPRNSAISVRSDGTGLPLFFVPSGMGDYSYVFGLSQQLHLGYPIYALPWPSISEEPMSTMEEQATRMINFMKAVQPEGPYRICGYSSGGILAYAIAQQLLYSSEVVNFLGLIDTPAPHYYRQRITPPKLQFFIELARQAEDGYIEEMAALYRRIDELNLVQFIETAQKLALYPANLRADLIAKRWEQIANYAQIVRDYEPQVSAITLHQFYAMESSPSVPVVIDTKIMDIEPQPLNMGSSLGWAQVLPDSSLRLIPISGNHFSLLENNEDKVALVQALNMALAVGWNEEVQ
ncbi:amino acid adenylation domain-containing protein, partial [Photorhabdus laumondii subsp. laumondii]|nr:amino acid adenylation domain-containing protein [Photorhabdus laumondii subsp. laumondii]NDL18350.1 amino acid adenylation domain-containing protein [Photorhabdus laumondii subsp. laumondii]NDL28400.1 amino acid adenylation domain-containing protein [Photorhabdus laumondii subsp. laumondii]NDL32977.1 amino acid adenylation domain-containing protein [Photorhabdus laumondii subsp. laumondii]NDL37564.1 amino acid adenylation domain-containing protein [Photorhabdus laumondii subsp. laumondii]